jgi:hypothetical protein
VHGTNSTPGFCVQHRFSTVPQSPFFLFIILFPFFEKQKTQRGKNTLLSMAGLKCFCSLLLPKIAAYFPWMYASEALRSWSFGVVYG